MNKYLRFFLRAIFLAIILYLTYETITGPRGLNDMIRARRERIKLSLQLQQTRNEKVRIENEILAYKNDPRFLEGEVRKQTKKGKKGEIFYIFPEDNLTINDDKVIK